MIALLTSAPVDWWIGSAFFGAMCVIVGYCLRGLVDSRPRF